MKSLYLKIIIYLGLGFFMSGCSNQETSCCEGLLRTSQDTAKQAMLIEWVEVNIVENNNYNNQVILGGGMWPGIYWLPTEFDWGKLGFSDDSQVRLVGDRGEGGNIRVDSVFFGERSRFGILVKPESSSSFGVDEGYLYSVSKNISVVCKK